MTLSPFRQPWHFNYARKDKEGEYCKIVGRFEGDWKDELETMRGRLWYKFNEKPYNEQGYNFSANRPSEGHVEEDAENPDGKPDARIFSHFKFRGYEKDFPKIQKMTDFFEFNKVKPFQKKLDEQMPNDQLMWHIDNLPGNPRPERVFGKDFKYQEPDALRILIMLEDWQPGQIAQFGTMVYTQWKAGTIFTWEWSTLPHVTWNGSWYRRMALQLTGHGSEKTWDIVRDGSADKVYKI